MRILVLSPSRQGHGGIQRYSTYLVRALRELVGRRNVRWLALPGSPPGEGAKRLPVLAKVRFVLWTLWTALTWRPNLIVATHIGLAPLGRLLQTFLRCPYWVVAHGIEVWGNLPPWKQKALQCAAKVLSVSNFTRQRLASFHQVIPNRIVIVPNVLDFSFLSIYFEDKGAKRLPKEQHIVLTVGRLAASERYKGHDIVLKALPKVVKEVPNVLYVIVGDGDDRPRLENLARSLGIMDYVRFVGKVSDEELWDYYRACDVFVMPSRTVLDPENPKGEGFGIVFLEAMAFGKPVIGPNYGAPTEFIRPMENGLLVDPYSPWDVARAIIYLLKRPGEAKRMGQRGRELVEREYSLEAMRRRLERLLKELGGIR